MPIVTVVIFLHVCREKSSTTVIACHAAQHLLHELGIVHHVPRHINNDRIGDDILHARQSGIVAQVDNCLRALVRWWRFFVFIRRCDEYTEVLMHAVAEELELSGLKEMRFCLDCGAKFNEKGKVLFHVYNSYAAKKTPVVNASKGESGVGERKMLSQR